MGKTIPLPTLSLLDCLTEPLSYTLYLVMHPEMQQPAPRVAGVFQQLFERSQQMATANGLAQELWRDGLFPVVAWIDEQLLQHNWTGRDSWIGYRLQKRHFQTNLAGRDFFTRLDLLNEDQTALREVYDICLALGFRGQHFQLDDQQKLAQIKEANLARYVQKLPLEMPTELFPGQAEALSDKGGRWGRLFHGLFLLLLWLLPVALIAGLYYWFKYSLEPLG